jgi:excisionase family DNA binding protein
VQAIEQRPGDGVINGNAVRVDLTGCRARRWIETQMSHTIPHTDQLRDELHGAGEHAKRMIDHIVRAACLLLEDRASDQTETSARIVTETAPAPSDKRELTVKELATRWGVSERSIYEWKTTGGLKFKKVGRLLRFDLAEADQWAQRHREAFGKARLRGKVTPLRAAATQQRSDFRERL